MTTRIAPILRALLLVAAPGWADIRYALQEITENLLLDGQGRLPSGAASAPASA